ncbi:MAG TPA: CRISPR-associated endonuclease Cas1, partial [Nitrosopumilus sp.]
MSITTKDNQIILKNGKHIYEKEHDIESFFPSENRYERLVISGNGIITTTAIKTLSEYGVNMIFTDAYGNPTSSLNFPMVSGVGSRNRIGQYDTFRDPVKRDYLQKQILKAKFESQILFLSSLDEDCRKVISILKNNIREIPNSDTRRLLSLEGHA